MKPKSWLSKKAHKKFGIIYFYKKRRRNFLIRIILKIYFNNLKVKTISVKKEREKKTKFCCFEENTILKSFMYRIRF